MARHFARKALKTPSSAFADGVGVKSSRFRAFGSRPAEVHAVGPSVAGIGRSLIPDCRARANAQDSRSRPEKENGLSEKHRAGLDRGNGCDDYSRSYGFHFSLRLKVSREAGKGARRPPSLFMPLALTACWLTAKSSQSNEIPVALRPLFHQSLQPICGTSRRRSDLAHNGRIPPPARRLARYPFPVANPALAAQHPVIMTALAEAVTPRRTRFASGGV